MIFLSEYHNTLKIGILTIIFLKKSVTRQKKRIFVVDFHIMRVFGNLRVATFLGIMQVSSPTTT